MPKKETTRTFESEMLALGLPPLKMTMLDAEEEPRSKPLRARRKRTKKAINEATVLRIIDKLASKE